MSIPKQRLLFDNREDEPTGPYTGKIESPLYEPRHEKPHLMILSDDTKTRDLVREIDRSSLPDDEKAFLRTAAARHTVFHYERIADYYAHSSAEMKRLMEKSALVIIDFDAAIELGYVKLCADIREQYFEEYKGAKPTS